MANPLVSVVIPVYNGQNYLSAALESVINQTYRHWELIVVNDGSIDQSEEVILNYKQYIRYFSQPNQGVAAARNLGLLQARGKYIAFLDQDDVWLANKLTLQVAFLEKNSHWDFVNSGWLIVNQQGVGISAVKPWLENSQLDLYSLIVWKPVFLGAMLFKRECLLAIKGFKPNLLQTSDVEMVMQLAARNYQAAWLPRVTVVYRQHAGNASNQSWQQAEELEKILQEFFAQPQLSPHLKSMQAASFYQSLVWCAWRLQHTGNMAAMAIYLQKSIAYNPNLLTEIILDWLKWFKKYSQEYGKPLTIESLLNSPHWQNLLKQLIYTHNQLV